MSKKTFPVYFDDATMAELLKISEASQESTRNKVLASVVNSHRSLQRELADLKMAHQRQGQYLDRLVWLYSKLQGFRSSAEETSMQLSALLAEYQDKR